MTQWGSIWIVSVLATAMGCDAAPPAAQAQPLKAAGTPYGEELRLYARGGSGLFETNRHASGQWDAIAGPALFISGTIVQSSGVGRDGYVFSYDGRSGGVLLREAPGDTFRIVPLPPVPVMGAPPFLVGGDAVGLDALTVCGTTLQGKLLVTTQAADGGFGAWDDVEAHAGVIGSPAPWSCTASGHLLHGCAVDSAGDVRHTVRASDGSWQPWDDVEEGAGDIGAATQVRCRGKGGSLFVLARSDGGAFFTERKPNGSWRPWQHLAQALGDPRADELGELAVVNGEVHATGTGEGIWHTVRHADRSWAPIEDLQAVVPGYPPEGRTVRILSVQE